VGHSAPSRQSSAAQQPAPRPPPARHSSCYQADGTCTTAATKLVRTSHARQEAAAAPSDQPCTPGCSTATGRARAPRAPVGRLVREGVQQVHLARGRRRVAVRPVRDRQQHHERAQRLPRTTAASHRAFISSPRRAARRALLATAAPCSNAGQLAAQRPSGLLCFARAPGSLRCAEPPSSALPFVPPGSSWLPGQCCSPTPHCRLCSAGYTVRMWSATH